MNEQTLSNQDILRNNGTFTNSGTYSHVNSAARLLNTGAVSRSEGVLFQNRVPTRRMTNQADATIGNSGDISLTQRSRADKRQALRLTRIVDGQPLPLPLPMPSPAPVPLPAGGVLLLSGLMLMVVFARRRKVA